MTGVIACRAVEADPELDTDLIAQLERAEEVVSEGGGKWQLAIQLPGSGKRITHSGSAVGQVSCGSAATCVVGGTLQVAAPGPDGRSGTRGFLAGEVNGRWGLYVVPGGLAPRSPRCPARPPGTAPAGGSIARKRYCYVCTLFSAKGFSKDAEEEPA